MAIAIAISPNQSGGMALGAMRSDRKEVKTVTYSRPEIVVLGNAAPAIQDPTNKIIQMVVENTYRKRHAAAYDLDE